METILFGRSSLSYLQNHYTRNNQTNRKEIMEVKDFFEEKNSRNRGGSYRQPRPKSIRHCHPCTLECLAQQISHSCIKQDTQGKEGSGIQTPLETGNRSGLQNHNQQDIPIYTGDSHLLLGGVFFSNDGLDCRHHHQPIQDSFGNWKAEVWNRFGPHGFVCLGLD